MTREEKIRKARELRAEGWTAPEIARYVQANESTVRNWYLGGDCVECGAPVTRCSRKYAADRCDPCARKITAEHGTRSMYNRGCGCDACREANRVYMRSLKGRPPPEHGTASGYSNYGCRCEPCRTAWRVYSRINPQWKKAWRERVRGTEPPKHGLSGYISYGCRCDICRAAIRGSRRRWRARKRAAA